MSVVSSLVPGGSGGCDAVEVSVSPSLGGCRISSAPTSVSLGWRGKVVQFRSFTDSGLNRLASAVEFRRCLVPAHFGASDFLQDFIDAVVVGALDEPTVVFRETQQCRPVLVLVALLASGDPLSDVLAFDFRVEFGETPSI